MASAKADAAVANKRGNAGRALTYEEKCIIMAMVEANKPTLDIAKVTGRSGATVQRFVASMRDSTPLAKATLRAGAAKLAARVVQKANVREAIEVLTRPDMGVLQPIEDGRRSGGGIQISVGIASCGTVVKVGITDGERANLATEQRQIEAVNIADGQVAASGEAVEVSGG